MNAKLRVGIAGYGVVGNRRRYFLDKDPRVQVTAVCDKNFTNEGVMEDGTKFFSDYRSLLKEKLDLLFVCLTNDIAFEVTIAGLEKGLHVFCEKPPSRTVAELERVMEVEKQQIGIKLKYGFNHRYHDSVRDALQVVRSGELGDLVNIRGVYGKSKFISFGQNSDWRVNREISGGGILLDQGIHMVDLIRLFANSEFNEIHSIVSNSFWRHDVEDNAYALMRSDDGVVVMLHSTATQWRHKFELELTCSEGGIILSGILSGSKSYGAETMTIVWADEDDQGDPREQMNTYNQDNSWRDEINEFIECIQQNQQVQNGSSADALDTMRLVSAIYLADREWSSKWNLT